MRKLTVVVACLNLISLEAVAGPATGPTAAVDSAERGLAALKGGSAGPACGTVAEDADLAPIRQEFCNGDAYQAICTQFRLEKSGESGSGFVARERLIDRFWKANRQSAEESFPFKKGWVFDSYGKANPEHLRYLERTEREAFTAAQVVDAAGQPLNFDGRFLLDLVNGVKTDAGQLVAAKDASGVLRARLSQVEFRLHSDLQKTFSDRNSKVDYPEGIRACAPGFETRARDSRPRDSRPRDTTAYAADDRNLRVSLCPGGAVEALAAFQSGGSGPTAGPTAVNADLLRLGLTAKLGHEVCHSIDTGQFDCAKGAGQYCGFERCLDSRYGAARLRADGARESKEFLGDYCGASILGRRMQEYARDQEKRGARFRLRERLRVLLANYLPFCPQNDVDRTLQGYRFEQISANPEIRKALDCGPLPAKAKGFCAP